MRFFFFFFLMVVLSPFFFLSWQILSHTRSIEISGFCLDSFSTASRSIEKLSFWPINPRQFLNPLTLASSQQILDTSLINRDTLACISFFFVLHFFLCVHSIFFFFFLKVYGSLFSSLPLYLFSVYLVKSFGFLYPLTIVSKRKRNLRIECLSSGGVIDLRGELHVKRKKVFDVTNLGGELVWYTLILIYILCCVSFVL